MEIFHMLYKPVKVGRGDRAHGQKERYYPNFIYVMEEERKMRSLLKFLMNKACNNRNLRYCALFILPLVLCVGTLCFRAQEAVALDVSIPAVGIDKVKATGLSGDGVNVGQLEEFHPDAGHDMLKDGWIIQRSDGQGNDDHATHVAGILMGQSYLGYEGVAPGAHLQTTGWSSNPTDLDAFRNSVDWLIISPQADIVNMSAGLNLFGLDEIADWAAAENDILFVAAAGNEGWSGGAQDDDTMRNPAKGYNVLAVGATGGTVNQDIDTENYKQLGAYSSQGLPTDTHINPDIVAPGSLIMSANMGGTVSEEVDGDPASGTSFAAPHVAGTAALLHQYSTNQNWNTDSRDHRVMKAVLMNSADKKVKDKAGNDWIHTEAYNNPTQALDDQLGAGGLDAWGAYEQYRAGEHGPGVVPLTGWNFGTLASLGSHFYNFGYEILAGNWITATLVWDRHVVRGDDFFAYMGLDNFDLWLWWGAGLGVRTTRLDDLSSNGIFNTTEHFHSLLPLTGWYTLEVDWVWHESGLDSDGYGLAWKTTPEPSTFVLMVTGLGILFIQRRRKKQMNLSAQ